MRYFCDHLEQIAQLEEALAAKPPKLQLNLIGSDDLPPDIALLARSVLANRSPKTHLVTNARSSLQGGAVLMWLLGDTRLIREDTRLFFRKLHCNKPEDGEEWKRQDSDRPEMELEEVDYAQVLQQINHFLPVSELAGRPVDKETLKQFGLVDNEKADEFLATIFAKVESKPVPVASSPKHEQRKRAAKTRKAIPRHPAQ
jgi:hypothetical protein